MKSNKHATQEIKGNIVDLVNQQIFYGTIDIQNSRILKINKILEKEKEGEQYIAPGLVDSHIHIESSLLTPQNFANIALRHGTIGAVCDPHEIANVSGIEGINFMIKDAEKSPFKFYFAAPSAVPASQHETNGAKIGSHEIEKLFSQEKSEAFVSLGEVMNFPDVINQDKLTLGKIELAKKYNKKIDGHAPGLSGHDLQIYADVGITTDHECSTLAEAKEKISSGMKVQLRQGSAAKNFSDLIDLLETDYENCMLCSDDLHPHELINGHINLLVKEAINKGINPLHALTAASLNPIKHYNLNIGLLQEGDPADFIVLSSLADFDIIKAFINGLEIHSPTSSKPAQINNFKASPIETENLKFNLTNSQEITAIEIIKDQLLTNKLSLTTQQFHELVQAHKIQKIIVLNRYTADAKPAIGYIKGFNFNDGAIASSVAHDSHNIIATGTNDSDIVTAVNEIIKNKGGLSVVSSKNSTKLTLPLPIAGLMSNKEGREVAKKYIELVKATKQIGCALDDAFMTLSFMSLTVIPQIKISDKGTFDFTTQEFIT